MANKTPLQTGFVPYKLYLNRLIKASIAEDVAFGDITTEAVVPKRAKGSAIIRAKEDIVVAGLFLSEMIFKSASRRLDFEYMADDGASVDEGMPLARISGSLAKILLVERVALNFLQRLSGIATLTKEFLNKIGDANVEILDTRKTTPCLRALEKYAVKLGGGSNHRFGLFDGIIIKDNHIDAVGGVKKAVEKVKSAGDDLGPIEVEVRSMEELEEALESGADVVMLDNMSISDIKKAVKIASGRVKLEVSGGVNLNNVAKIARTGVDSISIGAITHSARSVDIALEIDNSLEKVL